MATSSDSTLSHARPRVVAVAKVWALARSIEAANRALIKEVAAGSRLEEVKVETGEAVVVVASKRRDVTQER